MSETVDPGKLAGRLSDYSSAVADVRHDTEAVVESLGTPIRAVEDVLALRQQELVRCGNRAADADARRVALDGRTAGERDRLSGLASAVDGAQLHAREAMALVDQSVTSWEAEMTIRRDQHSELKSRLETAKAAQRGRIQAEIAATRERIECAEDAVEHGRRARGLVARAQLAAERAGAAHVDGVAAIDEAEHLDERAGHVVDEANNRVEAGRQALLRGADILAFAKRSRTEVTEAAATARDRGSAAESALDSAASRLRDLDRGGQR